jgi:hypothetical protein
LLWIPLPILPLFCVLLMQILHDGGKWGCGDDPVS